MTVAQRTACHQAFPYIITQLLVLDRPAKLNKLGHASQCSQPDKADPRLREPYLIMSTTIVSYPSRLSNSEALSKSQEAGKYIQRDTSATAFISLPFLPNQDSAELWTTYENLLYSCLRTGDDKAAHFCLERLANRFGTDDERVMGLRGLYQEAMAEDGPALLQMLHEYDEILAEDPTNTVMALKLPSD